MITFLLVLQFVLVVILVIAILLQKSSSIGLGAYSGSNESLFGAKGPAGFLAKFTFIMGFVFIVNTLALGYYYNHAAKDSIANQVVEEQKNLLPKAPASNATSLDIPSAPKAPTVPANK